jgi:hypothetical protein
MSEPIEAEPRAGDCPPPCKENWKHSEMVLVYYSEDPEMVRTSKWSVAYYHYEPPFDQKPHWVDFNTDRGKPDFWWPLPRLPEKHQAAALSQVC